MKSIKNWKTLSALVTLIILTTTALSNTNFSHQEVSVGADFPEAAEPDSIKYICAADEETLSEIFKSRDLPFDPDLVKCRDGEKCHIWYFPTVKGFQADPENKPIQGLMFTVDTLSYLSGRTEVVGDSLDIVKYMLPHISRPLNITLGINYDLDDRWHKEALKIHFEGSRHNIKLHQIKVAESNPWAQDYIKSGKVGNSSVALVPRRIFEGSPEYGEQFKGFLDEISDGYYVRSKLSWEGGDLMFLRHPRVPGKTIMFFGDMAKNYWGKDLTNEEYGYVLKLEFGAEYAVNLSGLSGLAGHIDYFVSFIPEENIALVSEPLTGNKDLAYAALEAIGQRLKKPYTLEIVDMAKSLSISAADFRKNRKKIRKALENLKVSYQTLQIEERIGIVKRLEMYITQNCSDNPETCFVRMNQRKMFEKDLPLIRDMVSSAKVKRADVAQIPALLSVIESQLPDYEIPDRKIREQKISELEDLGLKVIRVPRIAGDESLQVPWAGISYVNSVLVDRLLFIPVLGLTEIEALFLSDLKSQLPPDYQIIPIYARTMILSNGGIHCATGIIRGL